MTIGRPAEEEAVDDLIREVKSCTLDPSKGKVHTLEPDKAADLSDAVKKLSIKDSKPSLKEKNVVEEEKKKKVVPVTNRGQPQEDDERDESGQDEPERKENVTVTEVKKTASNMVTLPAPKRRTDDAEEEEDDEECGAKSGGTEVLEERGPMLGVPPASYHHAHQHILQKSYIPIPNGENLQMPANFPSYGNQQNNGMINYCNSKGKRGMEAPEMYQEPPKYTRPQTADQAMMAEMRGDVVNDLNNLNAPKPLTNDGKMMTNVYQKQMSGGTVYAPDQPSEWEAENLDSFEFPEQWNIRPEEDVNIKNLDELFGLDNDHDPNLPIQGTDQVGSVHFGQGLPPQQPPQQQQQLFQQQNVLPQFSGSEIYQCPMNIQQQAGFAPKQFYFQQQPLKQRQQLLIQQQQQQQHHVKQQQQQQSHFMQLQHQHQPFSQLHQLEGAEDMGYGSDLSPIHDPQMSPEPANKADPSSPRIPSPTQTSHMSSPRSNFSPPPSNMSESSHDSGVGSPMSEQQNGEEHSEYIDKHLEELEDALATANKDLMDMRTSGINKNGQRRVARAAVNGVVMPPTGTVPPQIAAALISPAVGSVVTTAQTLLPHGSPMMAQSPPHQAEVPVTAMPTTVAAVLATTTAGQAKDNVFNPPASKPINIVAPVAQAPIVQQAQLPGKPQAVNYLPAQTPQRNKDGKIAIPPMYKTPKPQVTTANTMYVVQVINKTPAKPQPRYLPIAPKEPATQEKPSAPIVPNNRQQQQVAGSQGPARPAEEPAKTGNNQAKQNNSGTPPPPQQVGPQQSGANNGRPGAQLLTYARRLVADMTRKQLAFKDEEGDTYLHVAVCHSDGFMVQALLERLDREQLTTMQDMQNGMGQTPLYLAVSTNHSEMVQLLVNHGADPNRLAKCQLPSGGIEQMAAIHSASSKGEKYLRSLLALLKAKNIDLNLVNSDGHTALQCAILSHGKTLRQGDDASVTINSIPIIQALLQHGADPNLQVQKSGRTALMYALESHDLDLIESTFQAVDPIKLPCYLKTQAFDNNTCLKIAECFKQKLSINGQQRLTACLRPPRGLINSASSFSSNMSPMSCSPVRSNSP